MKGNKPPTPEPPIPTLAEFIETCRAEFRFLVDDFGFQEARYSDPYQQFLVRFIKDDRWLDVYGEGYGTIAACRVGCGTRGPLALIWLVPEVSLPKRSRQRDQMGQLDQIRELGQFAREHAKGFLSGDTSRFERIWDAQHAPRPQKTGPSRFPP